MDIPPAQLNTDETLKRLLDVEEEVEISLEENKSHLLNIYSVLVRELNAEVVEMANKLEKKPEEIYSRKIILERFQQMEIRENAIFQLTNQHRINQKKIDLLRKRNASPIDASPIDT